MGCCDGWRDGCDDGCLDGFVVMLSKLIEKQLMSISTNMQRNESNSEDVPE